MTIEMLALTLLAATIVFIAGYFLSRTKAVKTETELLSQLAQQQEKSTELQAKWDQANQSLEVVQITLGEQSTQLALNQQQLANLTDERDEHQHRANTAEQKNEQLQASLAKTQSELATTIAKLQSANNNEQVLNDMLTQQIGKVEQLQAERNGLSEELATLKTSLSEKEAHFAELLAQLNEQKEILKKEFQNLANEILEAKGRAFSEQNKISLDAMLNPFRQQISDFKGKVENLHLEGTKQQTEMRMELKQLQAMHQQMTQEAHNLATALRGQKKVQGNWGELILENVLERSGLQLGKDYKREDSFKNDEGGRGRPDVVVYLPQDKHLIIDAKVSLNAYTRYVNAESEIERKQAINDHVKAFEARIKELAERDYYKLNGLNSPEMVFMFVPIESAFVDALKADETLFQKAIEKNVLVATPTTLLTSLNIVRQLWRYEDQNKHTAELARKAEGVFKKLKTFLNSFEGVKKGLDTAQEAYNKAEGQLVAGKGNLVKQVSDFKRLAPAIKDQLPTYFTDKAELELNHKPEVEAVALVASEQTNELEIQTETNEKETA